MMRKGGILLILIGIVVLLFSLTSSPNLSAGTIGGAIVTAIGLALVFRRKEPGTDVPGAQSEEAPSAEAGDPE